MKEEKPLSPREFLAKYQLPQLVRIHEAHLQQVNEIRARQINRNRSTKENELPVNNKLDKINLNNKNDNKQSKISILSSLTNTVQQQIKSTIKKDDELNDEIFSEELVVDDDDFNKCKFNLNTLASSSDSGNASAASSNCSENQYPSNSSPDSNKSTNLDLKLIKSTTNDEKINNNQIENKKLLDLDQPFLLYKSYTSRQVIAHILDVNSTKDTLDQFKRTGPALLIPETYSGWFSLVTSVGQTAGYFKSIDELANAQVPFFMSRDSLTAIPAQSNGKLIDTNQTTSQSNKFNDQSKSTKKIFLPAGTSFRLLGLYEDVSNLIGNKKKSKNENEHAEDTIRKQFLGTFNEQKKGPRFLKCLALAGDQLISNQMVFISTTETGRFYVICKKKIDRNSNHQLSYNHVYKLSQLLNLIKLPATVQLVVGQKPREYNSILKNGKENRVKEWYFSSVIKLEQFKIRDVILASTIRPQPFRLDEQVITKTNNDQLKQFTNHQKRTQSFASTIRKSLLNHSIRKLKKRKSILNDKSNLDFIEDDGSLSTKNGDLAILLEFDLDSNFKFIPYRSELNNLIANNLVNNSNLKGSLVNYSSMSSLYSQNSKFCKSKSLIDQFIEHLPELILQRIEFCDEHSNQWRQQIKLAHDVQPKPPPLRIRSAAIENSKVKRANSLAINHNNSRINGFKYQVDNCGKMPSMDNILLKSKESFDLIDKQSNSKISSLFNKILFNKESTVNQNCKLISTNDSIKINSGPTSLPVISSIACSKSISNTLNNKKQNKLQSSIKEKKQPHCSNKITQNSIRLINGTIGTLRQTNSINDYSLNNLNNDDKLGDTNSLLYKRMLSYSTHSLEPKTKQLIQQDKQFINQQQSIKINQKLDNKVNKIKNDRYDMMRLIGNRQHSNNCSDSCCVTHNSNELVPKIPKIKLNRDLKLMKASLNNYKGSNLLRKSSAFSKSLDSLANLHLYESLEQLKVNQTMNNKLNQRISRKRTLNNIFPQIDLNNKIELNDDLLNDDELEDDLNDDIDLSDLDLDLNDDNLDDEIEFKLNFNDHFFEASSINNLDEDQKQQTKKIVLKKQPNYLLRQQKKPKILTNLPIKDTIIKKHNLNDQNGLLIKKNSFSSNYGSESSDESPMICLN